MKLIKLVVAAGAVSLAVLIPASAAMADDAGGKGKGKGGEVVLFDDAGGKGKGKG